MVKCFPARVKSFPARVKRFPWMVKCVFPKVKKFSRKSKSFPAMVIRKNVIKDKNVNKVSRIFPDIFFCKIRPFVMNWIKVKHYLCNDCSWFESDLGFFQDNSPFQISRWLPDGLWFPCCCICCCICCCCCCCCMFGGWASCCLKAVIWLPWFATCCGIFGLGVPDIPACCGPWFRRPTRVGLPVLFKRSARIGFCCCKGRSTLVIMLLKNHY